MLSADSLKKIDREIAKYPPDQKRSAVMSALIAAQDEHGWLSPDVIREVADALDETPAYVKSIASFYDQFHLAPIGEHAADDIARVGSAIT